MSIALLGFILGLVIVPLFQWPLDRKSKHVWLNPLEEARQEVATGNVSIGENLIVRQTVEPRSEIQQVVIKKSKAQRREIKLLCWIPSRTASGPTLDRIHATWGRTCDLLLFTSTSSNPELNVVKVEYPLKENLWNMIHPAWNYVTVNYLEQFDWFIKVDDDTYMSGDNFKSLVRDYDPEERYYLGHTAYAGRWAVNDTRSKFNLGAGHALSRGSLRWLEPFLPDSTKPLPPGFSEKCFRTNTWAEDVELRQCLFTAGFGDANNSKDAWGRENFMSFPPVDNQVTVRRPDSKSWFWKGKSNDTGSGARCCSSRPILWHGLKSSYKAWFYVIQFLLYDLAVDPSSVGAH